MQSYQIFLRSLDTLYSSIHCVSVNFYLLSPNLDQLCGLMTNFSFVGIVGQLR